MKKLLLAIMIAMFGSAVAMAQYVSFKKVYDFVYDEKGRQNSSKYVTMFLCVTQYDDENVNWDQEAKKGYGVEYAKDRGWELFIRDLHYRKEFDGKSCKEMIEKYRGTDYIIDTEKMSVEEIGKKIMEYIPKPPADPNRNSYDIVIPGIK